MKIQRMPEDIVPLLNDLVRRLTALETRPLGTVFINESLIIKDPDTGVETIIGDLHGEGEDRHGIKQWVGDTTPPPIPTSPMVSANLGVFSIAWDGANKDGSAQAPDFDHLNVYGNDGVSTKLVGIIKTKDEVAIVTGAEYNVPWVFWFTSVDFNGNESVKSDDSPPISVTPLVEELDMKEILDEIDERFGGVITEAERLNDVLSTAEQTITDTKTSLDNLENVKLPQVEADIEAAHQEIVSTGNELGSRLDQAETDLNNTEASLNTVKNTTIPALNQRLADAETEITETGAQLDSRLDDAFIKIGTVDEKTIANAKTASDAQTAADDANAFAQEQVALLVARGQNLVRNGDFEAGMTGWNASGTADVKTVNARSGSKSLSIIAPQVNTWPTSEWVPSAPGRTYYVEYYIREGGTPDASGSVGMVAQVKTAAGGTASHTFAQVATSTIPNFVFTKVSGTITPSTADIVAIRFAPWVQGPTTSSYDIDDFLAVDVTEAQAALSAAATAQSRADSAHTLAGTAQTTANNAMIMAGTKNSVFYSPDPPSGTASLGDTWRQVNTKGDVIAEWRWTAGNKWLTQQVTTEMISNLDVGKLTAGTANISDLVVEKLWAEVIRAKKITTDQLLVGSGSNLIVDPYFEDETTKASRATLSNMEGGYGRNSATNTNWFGGTQTAGTVQTYYFSDTNSRTNTSAMIPIVEGSKYRFKFLYNSIGGGARPVASIVRKDGTSGVTASGFTTNGTLTSSFGVSGSGQIMEAVWEPNPTWEYAYFVPGIQWEATVTSAHIYGGASVQNMTDGSLIVNGSIDADSINTNSIVAEVAKFINLDVSKLVATNATINTAVIEKLWTDVIRSRKITTDQLLVGQGENLIPWDMSAEVEGYSKNIQGYQTGKEPTRQIGAGVAEGNHMYMVADNVSPGVDTLTWRLEPQEHKTNSTSGWRVEPEEEFLASLYVKAGGSYGGGVMPKIRVGLYWYNEAGSYVATNLSAGKPLSWLWEKIEISGKAPATATTLIIYIRQDQPGGLRVDLPSLYRKKGASLIVDGAIEAKHITASESMSAKLGQFLKLDVKDLVSTGSATLNEAVINKLWSDVVHSRKITADMLVVGGTNNLIPNPTVNNDLDGWTGPSLLRTTGANGPDATTPYMYTSARGNILSSSFDVIGGAVYLFKVKASAQVSTSRIYVQAVTNDENNGTNPYIINNQALATGWNTYSGEFTMPSGATTAYLSVYVNHVNGTTTTQRFTSFSLIQMASGELIVDGAVTALKIKGNAVESQHILANAVKADKIEAGAIRATHLAIGTGRELVSNGSGQTGDNTGFTGFTRANSTASTPGYPGYFYSTAGQGTTNFLNGDSILRVKPNTDYKVSVWVRANASGSKVFLEPMTGSTSAGERTDPVYPFSGVDVPVAWTKWTSEFKTGSATAGTLYFRWFVNHTSGTNTNSIFYFTEFSVEEMVTGTVIKDGSITTRHVEASSISADKITIGLGSNLFPDPLIKDTASWNAISSAYTTVTGGGKNSSGNALRITAGTGQTGNYWGSSIPIHRRIPVVPGRTYRVTAWIKPSTVVSVGSNIAMYCRLYPETSTTITSWTDPSYGNASYLTNSGTISSSVWTKFEIAVKVPDDTTNTFMTPGFYLQAGYPTGSYVDWCDISVTEMSSGELIVDGSIDGKTITGALIQTDAAAEVGVKLTNTGIVAFSGNSTSSEDSSKTLSITGGRGVDYIGIWGNEDAVANDDGSVTYPTGVEPEQVASIDFKGLISGNGLSIAKTATFDGNITMDGEPLTDSHLGIEAPGEFGPVMSGRSLLGSTFKNYMDKHPQVDDATSWLTPLSHGFIANAYTNVGASSTLSSDGRWVWSGGSGGLIDRMMIQDTVEITNNRGYLISYNTPAIRETTSVGGTVGACVLRYVVGETGLGVNNGSVIPNSRTYINGGGAYDNPGKTIFVVGGQDIPAGTITMGLQVYTYDGRRMETTDTVDARYWNISVLDVGLATKGNTGKTYNLYRKLPVTQTPTTPAEPEETTPPAPPPVPKPKQYVKTWSASWWGNYHASGGINSYFDSKGRISQGNPPGSAGIQKGLIGFPSVTTTLSGATVRKVEVYVYAAHWYSSAGGTLVLGTHDGTSKPSSANNVGATFDVKRQKMAKPEGRWITLPSTMHAGFKSGSRRGIVTYINSSSLSYYGYLTGSRTKLRITYDK